MTALGPTSCGLAGDEPLPLGEVIALTSQPIAIFDSRSCFRKANWAFRQIFTKLETYLSPGNPWDIILAEAVRHSRLAPATAGQLSQLEAQLSDQPDAFLECLGTVADTVELRFRLTPLSNGGFALSLKAMGEADRRSSERELEQIMSKVLQACPTPLTMARVGDGQILYRSPTATELLGKGLNSKDNFVHREERADFITELLPYGRVDDMRILARRADGNSFPASISARLIDYRGEDVVVSSIDDLSETLAVQDELSRQREQIFQSEKMSALGEVLAGVAHELNNPLSIVVGNAQILLEDEIHPERSKRVAKLTSAAERCVRIVRTFLSMARDSPLSLSPVPAASLFDKAADAFQTGAPDSGLRITTEIVPGLPALMVDEAQIIHLLNNLITNAHHAIRDAGKGGVVTLSALSGTAVGEVQICVADDGPGVPSELAARIFDPLFTTKSTGMGTGIGLALCHRIVRAHKGTIQLDQSAEVGARFVIGLPSAPLDKTI